MSEAQLRPDRRAQTDDRAVGDTCFMCTKRGLVCFSTRARPGEERRARHTAARALLAFQRAAAPAIEHLQRRFAPNSPDDSSAGLCRVPLVFRGYVDTTDRALTRVGVAR